MPRQAFLFLTDGDVAALLDDLEKREPGLVVSWGRYLRGDPADLLLDPTRLEHRESLPAERRAYLFHRKHCGEIVAHPQPAGPFVGWSQIDEERTEALVLRVPSRGPGELWPSRLYAHTTFWRAEKKTKKRPVFAIWVNQTLRWIRSRYPPTSVPFMRIGPDALSKAQAGALRLTYLYRTIAPEPDAQSSSVK
jgi:hypothetical protein